VLAAVAPPGGPAAAVPAQAQPDGYRLLGGDGGVFSFGLRFEGSAASDPTACPPNVTDRQMPHGTCLSMATTPDGNGYWVLNASTGAVLTFGDATEAGSPTDARLPVPREFVPNSCPSPLRSPARAIGCCRKARAGSDR
jgi:hypothetical protein